MVLTNTTHTISSPNDVVTGFSGAGNLVITSFIGETVTISNPIANNGTVSQGGLETNEGGFFFTNFNRVDLGYPRPSAFSSLTSGTSRISIRVYDPTGTVRVERLNIPYLSGTEGRYGGSSGVVSFNSANVPSLTEEEERFLVPGTPTEFLARSQSDYNANPTPFIGWLELYIGTADAATITRNTVTATIPVNTIEGSVPLTDGDTIVVPSTAFAFV